MAEPMFAVPLSTMVHIEKDGHGDWGYDCLFANHHFVYNWELTYDEAVALAVDHLAEVHCIVPVPSGVLPIDEGEDELGPYETYGWKGHSDA